MATESVMLALGTPAPPFTLPDPATGKIVSLADFAAAPALVVTFLGNHCPYVQRVAAGLARLGHDLAAQGVAMLVISSELPEVLGIADRIVVMQGGRVSGELAREDATEERILTLAIRDHLSTTEQGAASP